MSATFRTALAVLCGAVVTAGAQSNQLLTLPLPEDGFRYHSLAELEFKWPASHGEGSVCLWGDDKFAAVSFTTDDNTSPDWPFWRQASATYGWKFTWFVIVHPYVWDVYNNVPGSNQGFSGTPQQWKALHEEGHDIQLHGNTDMNALLDPEYEDQMIRASAFMESVISNKMDCFAYPGGTPAAGIPPGVDRVAIARRNMTAARGGLGYGITKPAIVDYTTIPSIGPALDLGPSGYWAKLEQQNANMLYNSYRGWAVVLNHGVDEAGTTALFEFLKANEAKYWIRPFRTVAHYGQERDSSTLNVTTVTADRITFELTDLMSDEHFDTPLTVKFRVNGWGGAAATQNGHSIPARIVAYSNNTYALVDAVPDQGAVTLSKSDSVDFTASPVSGWNPLTVSFTDASTFAGITNRFWNFGDGATTNTAETNIVHVYTVDGTYTVQMIVSGSAGVYTNVQSNLISLTTPVAPTAGFTVSPASGSSPLPVTFTDTSTGTITNRFWDFGDGVTTNTASTSVAHTYSSAGTNTVRLIVSGPLGISTNTQVAAVTVTAPIAPTAGFTATPTSGTAPMLVTFADTSTGTITNRFWSFGDGTTTNTISTNVTHTYTVPGTKTVTLVVSGPVGASTNTQTDVVSVASGTAGSLIIYDSFSSPTSTPLVLGWAPPGWTTDGTTANGDRGYIKGGSLSYSGLPASEGNSLGLGAGTDDYFLNFQTVSLAVGDTVYFSFIEKYNVIPGASVTGVGGFIRLANSADAVSVTKGICISRGSVGTPAATNAGFAIATANKTFGVSPAVSTPGTYDMLATYLVVGSYTRGATATDGSLKLWINPDSATFGTSTPPAPTLSMASASSADTFNQLRIGSNGSTSHPTDWQIDEVRVGTSWASAVPSAAASVSAPAITSALLATGTVGQAFSYQITADNTPVNFSATGLPSGLSINTNSGAITGTPAVEGSNSVTISASNAGGTDSKTLAIVISPVPVDANGNGIPDAWENQHGITNSNPQALSANGINTILESYIAGLNPTNPAERFHVSAQQSTSQRLLRWSAASGRVYSVYWTTNLLNGFQPLETNVVWPQNSWTDTVYGAQGGIFYRIKVQRAP